MPGGGFRGPPVAWLAPIRALGWLVPWLGGRASGGRGGARLLRRNSAPHLEVAGAAPSFCSAGTNLLTSFPVPATATASVTPPPPVPDPLHPAGRTGPAYGQDRVCCSPAPRPIETWGQGTVQSLPPSRVPRGQRLHVLSIPPPPTSQGLGSSQRLLPPPGWVAARGNSPLVPEAPPLPKFLKWPPCKNDCPPLAYATLHKSFPCALVSLPVKRASLCPSPGQGSAGRAEPTHEVPCR